MFALGAAYRWSDRVQVRVGYNFGRNPIPDETLSPLLAPNQEHHFAAGIEYRPGSAWQLDLGLQYEPRVSHRYHNASLPFGPGARETQEILGIYLGVSRRW